MDSSISFEINGKLFHVNAKHDKISAEDKLVDFIRDRAGLRGTKWMCREGGCGACVVSIKTSTPSGVPVVKAVNSCLVPTLSCDGWDITTVEHLGNAKEGYHPIQKRLATFGGTQCGFCTSGMCMSMYSLANSKSTLKMKQIEKSLDGNICRCTGYRPILDAFKSLASDAPPKLLKQCKDIEEIGELRCGLKGNPKNQETYAVPSRTFSFQTSSGQCWIKVRTLKEAFDVLGESEVALVGGNTGSGIYKNNWNSLHSILDIGGIDELKRVELSSLHLSLGSGLSLTKAINVLKESSSLDGFSYAHPMSHHIQRIANLPVRNIGTLGGNLMLKKNHRDFPSDLFTLFEAVGADVVVASSATFLEILPLPRFLSSGMAKRILVSVRLPKITKDHVFKSFKISRRFQNAHAYVNAGFLFKVSPTPEYRVMEKPSIVFGGISNEFIHATNTENFLVGKSLNDNKVLDMTLRILEDEVLPTKKDEEGTIEYRKLLTQTLLYKNILGILGNTAQPALRLGGESIKRNLQRGIQSYETDASSWPINQPVLKIESLAQVSGKAEYINDIHPQHGELYGAFVLSTVAKGDILSIDPSEAYKIPGVVRFIQARDIPGTNNYMTLLSIPDPIFAQGRVDYAGQSIGLVLGDSQRAAFAGAKSVRVEYGNVEKGTLSIRDGMKRAMEDPNDSGAAYDALFHMEVRSKDENADNAEVSPPTHVIKGEFAMGAQYHFQMETHVAIVHPLEDGLDVYSSTQWMDLVQSSIASALNIPNNEINIRVRRLGGAFGSKITRASQIATAAAIAAHITSRPVRVALDLQTNMELIGKRNPYLMKYEVGVDGSTGRILSLKGEVFSDPGCTANDETVESGISWIQSIYKARAWSLKGSNVLTNTAPNTWCRAPGSTPGIALIENIMEHIAMELKLDPVQVRLVNMMEEGDALLSLDADGGVMEGENLIPRMIQEVKSSGEWASRAALIETFNGENRWRKRGMALVPLRYSLEYFGDSKYPVYVSIYKNDGTVGVSHGGIECGQGLNTKLAQVVAHEFQIPLHNIRVKPSDNFISPNAIATGGSITSEICCFGALKACQDLKERMAPVKEKYNPKNWAELIACCNKENVQLSSSYMPSPRDKLRNYNIYVVNLTEVEIDVLTGEYKIVRMDVIEDAGKSLNPAVDIGQVEGALVMGIGYWTTEKLYYDECSGQLLSNGTWSYKPPLSKDIPEDFRVTLLKNAPNPVGILSSKATGEPPQCSAVAVLFALKNAIHAARKDAGDDSWFQLDGPVTAEDVLLKCLTRPEKLRL